MGGSNDDDGGGGVDGDGFGGNSPSRQGAETETSVPELGFLVAAELRNSSGEIVDSFRVFEAGGLYRRKGGARGWLSRPHHVVAPPPPGRAGTW